MNTVDGLCILNLVNTIRKPKACAMKGITLYQMTILKRLSSSTHTRYKTKELF